MLKPLGQLLPEALNRMKVRKPVEAAVVCRACDDALSGLWDHAVPMRTISFRAGVATVAVTSSAWSHEVLTQSERIKAKANKKLPSEPVKQIKTRVAPNQAKGEQLLE